MAKNGFSMSNRVATEELEAAKTLTVEDCGKVFTLAKNDGFTVTLPDPTIAEAGWNCKFIVDTAISSNEYIISSSATTDLMRGGVSVLNGGADSGDVEDTAFFAPNGTDHTAIKLNGTTKGGAGGDMVELTVLSGQYHINGILHGSGTLVTPFG
jgi:hypothetical protein